MKHTLAPFCSWEAAGEALVLRTPDYEIKLRPEAEPLLERLKSGWVEADENTRALKEYGAVIAHLSAPIRLLRRLEMYFEQEGVELFISRKGSTTPEAALDRHGYLFKTGPHTMGLGQSRGRWIAQIKAAAELYERLSCDARRNEECLAEPEPAIRMAAGDELVQFADWQYNRAGFPFSMEPSGHWVRAEKLGTKETALLPLELVCYPDRISGPRIMAATSNGVAAHTRPDAALLGGALELIERDALMLHWFRSIRREKLIPPPGLRARIRKLERLGFKVTFLNLTVDLMPVVLCVLHRHADRYPRLLLGMAAHKSAAGAMARALEEVEINVTFLDISVPDIQRAEDICQVIDHQFWYDRPENHEEVLGLIGDEEVTPSRVPDGPGSVDELAALLREKELSWYVVELNPRGREATGVTVLRSVIPGLIPISFGYTMEPLGLPRLHDLPAQLQGKPSDLVRMSERGYRTQPFA